ncbi:MAG: hypothetical protein K0V04_24005, partial [Deltaproteobacteria bacterium]|nr:hypothetical protein [Deltaproteobacteria bacterium]
PGSIDDAGDKMKVVGASADALAKHGAKSATVDKAGFRAKAEPPPGDADATKVEPYRRPVDDAAGVDAFVFWGWSADGRYFAFETFHAGSGMANCEGEAELSIVDATADRYAPDGHILLTPADAEAEVCDPPDLRVELGYRRKARLERYKIDAAHIRPPIAFEGTGERWSFATPSGERAKVAFRVVHGTDDAMEAVDGAAFELRVTAPGRDETIVEPGTRRRPWTLGYDLAEGMVFVAPGGNYAALMVAQHQVMPEGVRTTWMSSGVTLR